MKKVSRLFVILGIMLIVSCGDEKEKKETITIGEDNTLEEISTEEADVQADTADRTEDSIENKSDVIEVRLTGNDQMKFNLTEIRVKEGQKVRLVLTHIGELSEEAMGHNFVLLTQGTDIVEFAQEAITARENDYIPEGSEQVIAYTEMIGGGEETTVEFDAPPAGTYDFICSFPGHYVQMQGKFIVE